MLLFTICFLSAGAYSSEARSTLIPASSDMLILNLKRSGGSWEATMKFENPRTQKSDSIQFDKRNDRYEFYTTDGTLRREVDWNRVAHLHFTLESDGLHPFLRPRDTVFLDSLQILQQLPFKILQKLEIDLTKYYGKVDINFEQWSCFKEWKRLKSLYSFVLKTGQMRPEFDVQSLVGFPLFELEVPCLLNDELLDFPELRRLCSYGAYSNFTHQLSKLKYICKIEEYGNRYNNSFETLHAERYYRTLLQEHPDYSVACYSDFDALVFLPQDKLDPHFGTLKKKGELLYYENDFPEYSGDTPDNDTLLHGTLKRSTMRGVWTFKLKDQYPRNDQEKHHIDFDHLPNLKFPVNGLWSFEYANGNTAIEGGFESGRKNGEWLFYNEDGTLRSTRIYQNDTLVFNKVQFNLHGLTLESRTYYASTDDIYQSIFIPDENEVRLNVTYHDGGSQAYQFTQNGMVNFREKGSMYATTMGLSSEKYQKFIREGIIDNLYPEYISQELPFKVK